jgi:glycosyltransferase involved in cell wall biosynthesis
MSAPARAYRFVGATPCDRPLSTALRSGPADEVEGRAQGVVAPDSGRPHGVAPTERDVRGLSPRVLLITGEYPPTVGGVGDYTATLAAHLRKAGADAIVLTGTGAAIPGETGVRRAVPTWGVRSWPAIARAIREERPDLVHIQYQAGAFGGRGAINLLPWWLARAQRSPSPPVVVTFHDLLAPYLFPKAGPLRQRAIQLLARTCTATIVTNGDDWARLRADPALGGHKGAGLLRLIPIGSNILPLPEAARATARATARAALGLTPGTALIAYFGLVSASKGLATLLDALVKADAARLADFHLLLIGGEASATDGATFVEEVGLQGALQAWGLAGRATVTGVLGADAVAAHLAAADFVVLPYRDGASWRRGSLLAALAAGAPVITTTPQPGYDAGGLLPSLRDGEDVLLVPPADADALAGAIVRLGGDASLRARLAAGARSVAAAFDWEAIARAHLALYADLACRPLPGRGAR